MGERHLRDQTMGQSVVRNFQRRGYEELQKCQEAETKLNEDWKTLKTTIESDVESMRGIYVRLKALEPISQEKREGMNNLIAKIADCQRKRSAAELDENSEFVKQSPFYRALTNLCGFESAIVRKDELEEKLQALIAEKEAREMEILALNAEKAEEVFRE